MLNFSLLNLLGETVQLGTTLKTRGNASRSRLFHALELVITLGLFFVASPLYAGCNLPPIPGPGETVTWAAANSPFQICADLTIPTGGTVVVEPGVLLQFQGHMVTVAGTMNLQGQSTNHITITAQDVFPPVIMMEKGNVTMAFTDVGGQFRHGPGKVTISDSTFTGPNGILYTLDILVDNPGVIKLTRCNFINSLMQITDSYLGLKDCIFTNSIANILRGYTWLLGANTVNGQPFTIFRETNQAVQPMLIDGVHASNVATGGGVSLWGGDFILGTNNILQGNLYPVDVEGGLLPSSVVPLTGNTIDLIWAHDGAGGPVARWANLGVPYLVDGWVNGGGTLTIDPGVTVLFDPRKTGFAGLNFVSTRRLISNGLPTAPITFDALSPGIPWTGLIFQTNGTEGNHLDYVTVEHGNLFGVSISDSFLDITNSLFQNNLAGVNANTFGLANLSKTRLFNNQIGAQSTPQGGFRLRASDLLPNWFEGNGTGVSNSGSTIPAKNNYWGSPTGPTNPGNPGGEGDLIVGPVNFTPFLTAPPDIANNPPVVRMTPLGNSWYGISTITRPPDFYVTPGEKLILRWTVSDSTTVAGQRILLSPQSADFDDSRFPPIILANNVPASARSLEVTIPSVGFAATNLPQFLRIVAIDSSAQQGWDQTPIIVSSGRITGNIQVTSDYSGQTFIGGSNTPEETWEGNTNGGVVEGNLFLESDGGLFTTITTSVHLPIVSTDSVRQVVLSHTNSNDLKWFFSPGYFSIRPDPALGIKAPKVQLTSPTTGQSFAGGSIVPIKWKASAKEGLRTFDIQYSANGGQTWHFIVKDLDPTARGFRWELPASSGIPDVRVRVIVRDTLFQNSSDGAGIVFSITP
jgi:hypothetical protein